MAASRYTIENLSANLSKGLVYLVLFAMLAISGTYVASQIFRTDVMTGLDGYYYVLQATSYKNTGYFYFPTSTPIILLLLTALSFFTPNEIFATKLVSVVLHLLLCIGVFVFTKLLTMNGWLGLLGMGIVMFTSLHIFFVVEFLSNLGAITLLLWSCVCFLVYLPKHRNGWLILSGSLLLLSVFSHRSVFFLLCFGIMILALSYLFFLFRPAKWHLRLAIMLSIFSIVLLVPLLAVQQLFTVPELISKEIKIIPELPFRRVTLMENLLMIAVCLGFFYAYVFGEDVADRESAALVLTGIVGWAIFLSLNPFLNHQDGFNSITGRLDVLLFLQVGISIPLLIYILRRRSRFILLVFSLTITPIGILRLNAILPSGIGSAYLHRRELLINHLHSLQFEVCDNPIVIAPHGEQFIVSLVLGVPSQQRLPTSNTYGCIYWVVHNPGTETEKEGVVLMENNALRLHILGMSTREFRELRLQNTHLRL